MATVSYVLDPANPPQLSEEEAARLDAMTEEEIEANALSDPDNPPPTEEESARVRAIHLARRARRATGMTDLAFADTFRINLARLRDIEQGRYPLDTAVAAYLAVIAHDPDSVRRALDAQSELVAG